MDDTQKIPKHIAIIMDGNGRWAMARGLPRVMGHQAGVETVRRVVEACYELGVKVLTLYAFSWENWDRPADEIRELMSLLADFIHREMPALLKHRICLRVIGRVEKLHDQVQSALRQAIEATATCDKMTLNLALSYGGRQEIVDAVRKIAHRVSAGTILPDQIDESLISQHLYAPDLPDPDLVIRTSGEQRLSNFLLWQSSYAELHVTQTPWPEFSKSDLLEALASYEHRERRFGRTTAST